MREVQLVYAVVVCKLRPKPVQTFVQSRFVARQPLLLAILSLQTGHILCSDGQKGHLNDVLTSMKAGGECANCFTGHVWTFPDGARVVDATSAAMTAGADASLIRVDPSKVRRRRR
jgi:hypothetical protein